MSLDMDLDMDMDIETEAVVVARSPHLTKIEPATFRGVDCAVLAERYVAYRRNMGLDDQQDDPDLIKPMAAPSSENV